MMGRRSVLGVLAGAAALVLGGCSSNESRYRQKITVEVETPAGVRTGFSVVEVGNKRKPAFLKDIPGNGFSVQGEAVAIDIAPGKTLFALLSQPNGGDASWYQAMLFTDAMQAGAVPQPALRLPGNGRDIDAHKVIGRSGAKLDLPQSLYPLLVTFKDIRDPKSVVRVEPGALDAVFGAGVKLRRITVAVTDEKVTTGIEERLAWLGELDKYRTDPSNPFTNTLPSEVSGLRSK